MQVDVLHRHHLRVAAAGRAALHAEHRPEGRLAQADDRLLADVVERVPESDRRSGLAFTRRRRADRGDQDELPVLLPLERVEVLERDLGLVMTIGLEVLLGDAELLARHCGDALQFGGLCDFDVRRHVDSSSLLRDGELSKTGRRAGLDRSQCRAVKRYFTSRTGMSEMCTTLVAVEPRIALPSSLCPRVPMQMRSQRFSLAYFTRVSATGPTSTCASKRTPASSSLRRASASCFSPSSW